VQVTAYRRQTVPDRAHRDVDRSCDPLQNFGGFNHITGTAEPKVVKFCTRVGYINSDNRWHITNKTGVVVVKWLFKIYAVCRDVARRAGLSATAELVVKLCIFRSSIFRFCMFTTICRLEMQNLQMDWIVFERELLILWSCISASTFQAVKHRSFLSATAVPLINIAALLALYRMIGEHRWQTQQSQTDFIAWPRTALA